MSNTAEEAVEAAGTLAKRMVLNSEIQKCYIQLSIYGAMMFAAVIIVLYLIWQIWNVVALWRRMRDDANSNLMSD
jgi:hypothetical protein